MATAEAEEMGKTLTENGEIFGAWQQYCEALYRDNSKAEAMVTPRRKCRRPAMVTPKFYPYP